MKKFIIVRQDTLNGMKFPIINEFVVVDFFETELEADIERVFLQQDVDDLLKVYKITSNYSPLVIK